METNIIISIVGSVIAIGSWYISDRRNKDRFEKELFDSFNSRYSSINQDILLSSKKKTFNICSENEKNAIIDYANICSEEYYWYTKKRISDKIWKSWLSGIRFHYEHNAVFKKYWDEEMLSNKISYYMTEDDEDFIRKDK